MTRKASIPDLSKKANKQPSVEAQIEAQQAAEITPDGQKFIEGTTEKNSSRKAMITLRIDADLLRQLDEKARSFGLNRTAYIMMLVKRSIQQDLKLEI